MTPKKPNISKEKSLRRFSKFILIGLVNTVFGYAVFAVLILLKTPPQPALAMTFVIGVAWNYMFHARLVFGQSGFNGIPAYIGSYLLIYGFNSIGLGFLLRVGFNPLTAQALLAPIAAVFSFVLITKALTGHFPFVSSSPTEKPKEN
ncbi:MAG: GtrA family protein [Paracoccaceae bacterium]